MLSKTSCKTPFQAPSSFLIHRYVLNLFRIKIFLCIAALPLSPEQALLSRHLLSRLLHKEPKRAKEQLLHQPRRSKEQLHQETRRRRSQLMVGRRRMEEERRMRRIRWDQQQQDSEKKRRRDDPDQQHGGGGGGVRRREDQDPSPVYPRRDQDPSPSIVYPQVSRQVMYPHFFYISYTSTAASTTLLFKIIMHISSFVYNITKNLNILSSNPNFYSPPYLIKYPSLQTRTLENHQKTIRTPPEH